MLVLKHAMPCQQQQHAGLRSDRQQTHTHTHRLHDMMHDAPVFPKFHMILGRLRLRFLYRVQNLTVSKIRYGAVISIVVLVVLVAAAATVYFVVLPARKGSKELGANAELSTPRDS
jgi:hypothetical protein